MQSYHSHQTREGLPQGWVAQWNDQYHAWFYIDERSGGRVTSWTHPLGPNARPPHPPMGGPGAPAPRTVVPANPYAHPTAPPQRAGMGGLAAGATGAALGAVAGAWGMHEHDKHKEHQLEHELEREREHERAERARYEREEERLRAQNQRPHYQQGGGGGGSRGLIGAGAAGAALGLGAGFIGTELFGGGRDEVVQESNTTIVYNDVEPQPIYDNYVENNTYIQEDVNVGGYGGGYEDVQESYTDYNADVGGADVSYQSEYIDENVDVGGADYSVDESYVDESVSW